MVRSNAFDATTEPSRSRMTYRAFDDPPLVAVMSCVRKRFHLSISSRKEEIVYGLLSGLVLPSQPTVIEHAVLRPSIFKHSKFVLSLIRQR